MLLIAMPKSASTSLAATIAQIAGLKCSLGVPSMKIDIPCEGYEEIQHYHNNMCERSPLFLGQTVNGRKTIFKEHILPTDRHLKILKKLGKVVILLRNPDEVADCYKRLDEAHFKKTGKHIDTDKIFKEMCEFHDRWQWWKSTNKNAILVYYEDLVKNYRATMKKILKHYGLSGKIIPLKKLKYTGVGVARIKEAEKVNNEDS